MDAKEQFSILCAFPALRAYTVRRGGFFFFTLAKTHRGGQDAIGATPLFKGAGGII
jgi:hypothetical protein